jgi:hypothetical protein
VFALTSCDDFFSTSWGKPREYDISKITLTRSNLKTWKTKTAGNPELAEALVKKIIGELDGKSGAEKADFQSAGIDLAIVQSGLGIKILEVAGSDLSDIDSEDGVKNLLKKVQSGSGHTAADNIAAIVSKSGLENTSAGSSPKFPDTDAYGLTADPANVGLAVMVLALSAIPTIDGDTDLSDLSPNLELSEGNVKIKANTTPTPNEIALAAYLNLIANDTSGKFDDNVITSGIKEAFLTASGED